MLIRLHTARTPTIIRISIKRVCKQMRGLIKRLSAIVPSQHRLSVVQRTGLYNMTDELFIRCVHNIIYYSGSYVLGWENTCWATCYNHYDTISYKFTEYIGILCKNVNYSNDYYKRRRTPPIIFNIIHHNVRCRHVIGLCDPNDCVRKPYYDVWPSSTQYLSGVHALCLL